MSDKILEKNEDKGIAVEIEDAQNSNDSNGAEKKKVFRVGTLTYTKTGLMYLFAWLLWGDFCFTFMETVIPQVLPLNLKSIGASNTVIALLMSTIPSILNFTVCPIISFRSDRMRTKWGRRIPILLFATPPLAFFLIAIGYSREVSLWLYHLLGIFAGHSQLSVTLGFLGLSVIGFQFFNMFTGSVFYYLFNDVVPETHLARFMSLFRVVGSLAGALFNFFILKYATTHMREIFLGAAILYFVAFMSMCMKVKEGEYPPPPELVGKKKGLIAQGKTYFLECFTHKFYWYFFLANTFWAASGCIVVFLILFQQSLGLSLSVIGKIVGAAGLISTVLLYPAGMISDKYHPLRTMLFVMFGMVIVALAGLVWLFLPNPSYKLVLTITIATQIVALPLRTLFDAAQFPMYMRLLPKERYGQFGSADAMVRSITIMVGGLLAGKYLDFFKAFYNGDDFYYRWVPVWLLVFQSLGLFFMWNLYKNWKRLGGDKNFTPPSSDVCNNKES